MNMALLSIGDFARATHLSVKTLRYYHDARLQGALGELHATASAQGADDPGMAGGIYGSGLFESGGGSAVVYLPRLLRPVGRVQQLDLPAADLAVVTHSGPEDRIDRAYGSLAAYVARHALAVDGPVREFYPVSRQHTRDPARWRTEIGWPVFQTRPA